MVDDVEDRLQGVHDVEGRLLGVNEEVAVTAIRHGEVATAEFLDIWFWFTSV